MGYALVRCVEEYGVAGLQPRRKRSPSRHPGVVDPTTDVPNDLWTADFRGPCRTQDHMYCYSLTIADQHMRFLPTCHGLEAVAYRSDKSEGPTTGTEPLDPIEFLARVQLSTRRHPSRRSGEAGVRTEASRGTRPNSIEDSYPDPSPPGGSTNDP